MTERPGLLEARARKSLVLDAERYLSAEPRPFLRWAGSKRALLKHIVDLLPSHYRTYREPFLGGGSLFFLLQPLRAHLSDSCRDLIETFAAVRRAPYALLRQLRRWPAPDKELYYEILRNRSSHQVPRAAEFIYLNKTCWNGLYRVNSRGEFNVPYGAPKTDHIINEANLLACSRVLRRAEVTLEARDFEEALAQTAPSDLVFLDPPYVTRHNDNGFVDYNERLFSWSDQERLARVAADLVSRGAHVILANAYHKDVLDLFPDFEARRVDRASTLASTASFRGRVAEAILWHSPTP